MKNTNPPTLKQHIIAGFGAGIVGTIIAFPFDIVKTHIQSKSMNVMQAIHSIHRIRGNACRGLGINLVGVGPEKAIALTVNVSILDILDQKVSLYIPVVLRQVIAGAIAGGAKCVITVPLEMIKMKEQIGHSNGSLRKVKTLSIRDLYRGHVVTLCRDIGFGICFFTVQGQIKSFISPYYPHKDRTSLYVSLVAGLAGGIIGAAVTTPFDSIKTRVQLRDNGTKQSDLYTSLSVAKHMYTSEGIKPFFRGLIPRSATVGILYGTIIMTFDGLLNEAISPP